MKRILFGVVLFLVAVGIFALAINSSENFTQQIHITGPGIALAFTPLAMYIAGAASAVFLVIGLFHLIPAGTRNALKKRKERRQQREKDRSAAAGTAGGSGSATNNANDSTAKIPDSGTSDG